jgi:RHS repeat-associated protein
LPGSSNLGAFGYTGQVWLPEIGEYYYKAREYDPELGRFLQADPIGYEDSPNLFAYVLNDPVNLTDPLGQESIDICGNCGWQNAPFETRPWPGPTGPNNLGSTSNEPGERPVVITARRIRQALKRQSARICGAGNTLQDLSDTTGRVAVGFGVGGAIVGGFGILTENPVAAGGGAALISTGAVFGALAGGLQLTGGIAQGLSGHGFGNVWKVLASGGTSAVLSRGLRSSIPRGWHKRARARATFHNRVTGNLFAVGQQLSTALAPTQVNCT